MAQKSVAAIGPKGSYMGKGKKSVGLAVRLALATMVGMSCAGVVAEAPVDLSGTYDVATLTPLERPKMFGNKQFLTREEAARISRDDAALKAARNNNSDPIAVRHRLAVTVHLGQLATLGATTLFGSTMATLRSSWTESSVRPF